MCLYVIRCLPIEGYQEPEVDYVFRSIVLYKLTYGLPVYASSMPELTTVQNVLQPCLKGKYTSHQIDIYSVLEQVNRSLFKKISSMPDHPLYPYVPETTKSSAHLRVPMVNTLRFKNIFFSRLFFLSNIEQLFNVMSILCNVDILVILLILSAILMSFLFFQHMPLLKKTIKTLVLLLLLFQQLQIWYAIFN